MLVLASSPRTTSRLGASMISLSAPPASIGTRTAPPPTVKLVTRSGALAARNSAAAVPMSGPTTWGAPRPHSLIRRARNAPEVSGAISSGRPSEWPNPGRSMATTRPTAALRAGDLCPGGSHQLLIGVGVAVEAPTYVWRLGQQHQGPADQRRDTGGLCGDA